MSEKIEKRSYIGILVLIGKLAGKLLPKLSLFWLGTSFVAYSIFWNWQFVCVLLGSLLVHEYGHVWAMKRFGMRVRTVSFIPFLGAVAVAEDQFPSRRAEAVIAIMGPLWGGTLAFATHGAFLVTDEPLVAALASWMALVNLFNLIPIHPLDGGRILKSLIASLHNRLETVVLLTSLFGAGILAYAFSWGIFYVLLAFGVLELLFPHWSKSKREADRKRIIKRLSELLACENSLAAVEDKYKTVLMWLASGRLENLGVSSELERALNSPILLRVDKPYIHTMVSRCEVELSWQMSLAAIRSRQQYKHPLSRKMKFVTHDEELKPGQPVWKGSRRNYFTEDLACICLGETEDRLEDDVRLDISCPLFDFLHNKELLEPMSARTGVVILVGTFALIIGLAGIMYASEHVPGAKAALEIFID